MSEILFRPAVERIACDEMAGVTIEELRCAAVTQGGDQCLSGVRVLGFHADGRVIPLCWVHGRHLDATYYEDRRRPFIDIAEGTKGVRP